EREWFRPPGNEEFLAWEQELNTIHSYLCRWAAKVRLNLAPSLPPGMQRRFGDNVNGLLSVADDCGPEWVRCASEAFEFQLKKEKAERPEIMMIQHGLAIFDALGVNVIRTTRFNRELKQLDLPDAKWTRYRGPSGTEHAHPLEMHEQAALGKKVGI